MSTTEVIANWEIFLWALYRLGGSSTFVDIEDVSLKCFELAPTRFGWRTKPDLPDYKKCAKSLQEAERRRPPMLVKTRDAFTRQLSVEGQKWIERNSQRMSGMLEKGLPVPEPSRRPNVRMLAEIERSEPFLEWRRSRTMSNEKWKVADILRCSPDSSANVWSDRLEWARGIAYSSGNKDVLEFLNRLVVYHPEWFGGVKHEG